MAYAALAVVATGEVIAAAYSNQVKDNFNAGFNTSGQLIASAHVTYSGTANHTFVAHNAWEDCVIGTITPRAASGSVFLFGGGSNQSDDPGFARLYIAGTTGPVEIDFSSGDSFALAYALPCGGASAHAVRLQGYISGGTGTDAFTDCWITALWIP